MDEDLGSIHASPDNQQRRRNVGSPQDKYDPDISTSATWNTEYSTRTDRSRIDVYEVFRPMIRLLHLSGVAAVNYEVIAEETGESRKNALGGNAKSWTKYWKTLMGLFCFNVVRVLVGAFVPASMSAMFLGDPVPLLGGKPMFKRIIAAGALLYAGCTCSMFLKRYKDKETHIKILKLFAEVTYLPHETAEEVTRAMLKWQRNFLILCGSLSILIPFYQLAASIGTAVYMGILLPAIPGMIINFAVFVYTTGVWSLSASWFIMNCALIIKIYNIVTSDVVRLKVNVDTAPLADNWDRFLDARDRHYSLTDLTKEMDKSAQKFIFLTCLVDIPVLCFIMYEFLWGALPFHMRILVATWMLCTVSHLFFVTLAAALVCSAAHRPYLALHGLGQQPIPPFSQMIVSLFVQKLGGSKIGLTCLDFFVITKSSTLKLFSVLFTYFVMLVQFSVPDEEDMECNCDAEMNITTTTLLPLSE